MRAAHHACRAQEVVSRTVVQSFVSRGHVFKWKDGMFLFSNGCYTTGWRDKKDNIIQVLSDEYDAAMAKPPATGADPLSADERKLLMADTEKAKRDGLKSALRAASIVKLRDDQVTRLRNSARRGVMLSSGDFFLNLVEPVQLVGHAEFGTITPDIKFPPLVLEDEVMQLELPTNYTLQELLAVDYTELQALIRNILGDSADAFVDDLATTMQCAPLKAVWVLHAKDRSSGRSAMAEVLLQLVSTSKIVQKEYLPCFSTGTSPCRIGLQQLSRCPLMFLDDMPGSLPVDFGLIKPWQNLSRAQHLPSPVPTATTINASLQTLFIIRGNANDPRVLVKNVDPE